MNTPLLSILIPSVVGRGVSFNKLKGRIDKQVLLYQESNYILEWDRRVDGVGSYKYTDESFFSPVQVLSIIDNKEKTIGEKRELLYQIAGGAYSWQIDDDDDISDDAIELILKAIKENPNVDCITFEERVRLDGVEFKSNHSLSYSGWQGDGSKELSDGFHFWRTPFFKSVIKTEIAKSVPVPHCRWGEDNMYADELHKVLKTEYHINKQLYYYDYISSPNNERYGIK